MQWKPLSWSVPGAQWLLNKCQLSFYLPWPGSHGERRENLLQGNKGVKFHKSKFIFLSGLNVLGKSSDCSLGKCGHCPPRIGYLIFAPPLGKIPLKPPWKIGGDRSGEAQLR